MYAEIALPLPLRQTFTYSIPDGDTPLEPGVRVLVPFGRRELTGYVISTSDVLDPELSISPDQIRPVTAIVDEISLITPEILELTKWAADYYAASWGEMLKAGLPAGINIGSERYVELRRGIDEMHPDMAGRTRVSTRSRIVEYLAQAGVTTQSELESRFGEKATRTAIRQLISEDAAHISFRRERASVTAKRRKIVRLLRMPSDEDSAKLTEPQTRLIATLARAGKSLAFTDLLEQAGVGSSPVTTLAKRGIVEISVAEVRRDPLAGAAAKQTPAITLNPDQETALAAIREDIAAATFRSFLLHGITGSGKTEVYIRAMRECVQTGRSAMMLVPEIALTPIFSRQLKAAFGDLVAILHSNLSAGERFDEWRRIRSGEARVVIGTRSAIFAPAVGLGLIIVDEEHDGSYRQNESPFYNARDLAVYRARLNDAVVVLGSATPSLETFSNARSGKYRLLELPRRVADRPLATAEIIDMREEFRKAGKDVAISEALRDAIRETTARGEQVMMLLNRRGFSQFVICRSCGVRQTCPNCDVTLTYHRHDRSLVCHYCGLRQKTPETCPECRGEFLYFIGHGTEQIESQLHGMFPHLRIERIDRDTMTRKGSLAKALLAFDRGETDMLVGTQMLAKGHDFHNVTLVGVISIDGGLGMPDFRSAERAFQLITQVAGRAGRGDRSGRVLIQTYYPEHYALRHAVRQDYEGFFAEEMRYRERMVYPPYVSLASLLVKHSDLRAAADIGERIRAGLDKANSDRSCRVLGPTPPSIARIKNVHRLQLLIKGRDRRRMREVLEIGLAEADLDPAELRAVQLEIDPLNVM